MRAQGSERPRKGHALFRLVPSVFYFPLTQNMSRILKCGHTGQYIRLNNKCFFSGSDNRKVMVHDSDFREKAELLPPLGRAVGISRSPHGQSVSPRGQQWLCTALGPHQARQPGRGVGWSPRPGAGVSAKRPWGSRGSLSVPITPA